MLSKSSNFFGPITQNLQDLFITIFMGQVVNPNPYGYFFDGKFIWIKNKGLFFNEKHDTPHHERAIINYPLLLSCISSDYQKETIR